MAVSQGAAFILKNKLATAEKAAFSTGQNTMHGEHEECGCGCGEHHMHGGPMRKEFKLAKLEMKE